MSNSVYRINKGINRPIEFKGLQGQYIWYFGGGVIALLLLFALLYAGGVNPFACVGIILATGALMTFRIYRMSNTYGPHGLMKKLARRQVPHVIQVNSRGVFLQREGSAGSVAIDPAAKNHNPIPR